MTLHLSIPLETLIAAACVAAVLIPTVILIITRKPRMSPNVQALAAAANNLAAAVAPLPAAIDALVRRLPDAEDGLAIQSVIAQLNTAATAIQQAVASIPT